jgi:hypothetical protein
MGLLLIFVNIRSLRAIVYYVQVYIVCGTRLSIFTDYGADTRKNMYSHPSGHFILYFPLLSSRSSLHSHSHLP